MLRNAFPGNPAALSYSLMVTDTLAPFVIQEKDFFKWPGRKLPGLAATHSWSSVLDMVPLYFLLGLKWYLLHEFPLGVSLCSVSVFHLNYHPFLNVGIWKLATQELTAVFSAFCDLIPNLRE